MTSFNQVHAQWIPPEKHKEEKSNRLNNWLNKYTSKIVIEIPTSNLSEIPVYDIPHPSKTEYSEEKSVLTWYIQGHMESLRALQWYNDVVTKISLCLDGTSLVKNVCKELTQVKNDYVYELTDFKAVEDMRYWKGKKIYIPIIENTDQGDEQFNTIRHIAYALKRAGTLTMDNLKQESLNAIQSIKEKYFKYQVKYCYEWTMKYYNAKSNTHHAKRTRSEQAQHINNTTSKINYNKVKRYYDLCAIKGIKPTIEQAIRVIKLSKNTILKYLAQIPILGNQTIRPIRGLEELTLNSLYLARDVIEIIDTKAIRSSLWLLDKVPLQNKLIAKE